MSDASAAAAGALQRVVRAVGEAADPGAVLRGCLEALGEALGADGVGLYVADASGGRLELRSTAGGTAGLPASIPLGGIGGGGGGSVVPARAGGRTVGGVLVRRPGGAGLSAGESAAVATAAQTLAMALRQAQLVDGLRDRVRELDRQARRLGALTRVAERIAASGDESGALSVIAAEGRSLAGADAALVMTPDERGSLRPAAGDGRWDGPPPHADDLARAVAGGRVGRGRRRGVVAIPGLGSEGPGAVAVMRLGASRSTTTTSTASPGWPSRPAPRWPTHGWCPTCGASARSAARWPRPSCSRRRASGVGWRRTCTTVRCRSWWGWA